MKTRELAVYILVTLLSVAAVFGMVPPLLNAHSTLLNAIGVALTVIVVTSAILVGHAVYTSKKE